MTAAEKLIKNKLRLLQIAINLQNVSEACPVTGYSRDTYYRVKNAYDQDCLGALKEKSRRKPRIRNRLPRMKLFDHPICGKWSDCDFAIRFLPLDRLVRLLFSPKASVQVGL